MTDVMCLSLPTRSTQIKSAQVKLLGPATNLQAIKWTELLNSFMSVQPVPSRLRNSKAVCPEFLIKSNVRRGNWWKVNLERNRRVNLLNEKDYTRMLGELQYKEKTTRKHQKVITARVSRALLGVERVRGWIRRQKRGSQSSSIAYVSFPVVVF